jgi:hypothetical protein
LVKVIWFFCHDGIFFLTFRTIHNPPLVNFS